MIFDLERLIKRRRPITLLLIGLWASAALVIVALHAGAISAQIILALLPVALQVGYAPRPPENKWMAFVDGENLTIRGQTVAKDHGITLTKGAFYSPDVFLWLPNSIATFRQGNIIPRVEQHAIRATYYTSLFGDADLLDATRKALRYLDFDPQVFKKTRREEKAKGVDIALTKDMLSHAFMGNYETAVLYAGDGDYLPLIEEVKRLGKRVHLHFFGGIVNEKLRLAADGFLDFTQVFVNTWKAFNDKAQKPAW